jgi:hypothetical protein
VGPNPIAQDANRVLAQVSSLWTKAGDAVGNIGQTVAEIRADSRFTDEARQQQVRVELDRLRSSTDTAMTTITDALTGLAARLRTEILPRRPMPTDGGAGQEARLTNLRADVQMALTRFDPPFLVDPIADLVRGYQVAGDQLAVWFLLTSDWVPKYLQSRGGAELDAAQWNAAVPELLGGIASEVPYKDLAVRLVDLLERPRGLTAATMCMRTVYSILIDQIAANRFDTSAMIHFDRAPGA